MKAMYYKEWIKAHWYLLISFLTLAGFTAFALLRFNRALSIKGADHLWEVMMTRDAIFVDIITYIPTIIGIGLAMVQFIPEMHRKCLKLTLHLPKSQIKMLYEMLSFGIFSLFIIFSICFSLIFLFLMKPLAPELYVHVLMTTIPWFLAGLAAYLLFAWICLEPTWKFRIWELIVSLLILRIYFLSSTPEAYNSFLPLLSIVTLITAFFSAISVHRFKEGKQD